MKKFNLLTVLEIKHIDKDGKILWEARNLHNTFHAEGEEFVLNAAFLGGPANTYIPEYYFFGLDSRTSIDVADTMETINLSGSEPVGNGYSRQQVSSTGTFSLATDTGNHAMALSPIITFTATGGGTWGPVTNLFFTNKTDNSGSLIASVALNTSVIVYSGQGIHMRMGLALGYCPNMVALP